MKNGTREDLGCGPTLRITYFILVKETEEKRAISNSLFLYGSLIYKEWENNDALFCLKAIAGSFQETQVAHVNLNKWCAGKCFTIGLQGD